ncbi:hypothetical protein [Intestinimonas butyriciproducens]|uniref:hypothetical protein n=1 Tax=Intestinimonas butyriciproducens TaxID=1297617 RepID=UPI00195952BF|nr:hypothetical protein [Intestinimonas butyriciproducens]MBM6974891.1 hypothetical protein [Intestinimonas butyriciproducens]
MSLKAKSFLLLSQLIASCFLVGGLVYALYKNMGYYTILGRALVLVVFLIFLLFANSRKRTKLELKRIFGKFFLLISGIMMVFNLFMLTPYGKSEQDSDGIINQSRLMYIDPSLYSLINTPEELEDRTNFLVEIGGLYEIDLREQLDTQPEIRPNVLGSNLWIFAIGVLWLAMILDGISISKYVFAAFPLGSIIYMAYFCILGFLNIKINKITVFILLSTITLCAFAFKNRKKRITDFDIEKIDPSFIKRILISIMVIAVFSYLPMFFLSNDSLGNIPVAQNIADTGYFEDMTVQSTRGFLCSALSVITFMSGNFFNYAFQPALTLIAVLFLFDFLTYNTKRNNRYIVGLSLLLMGAFLIPIICIHGIWVLNNLPIGILTLLFSVFFYEYLETDKRNFLILSAVFLALTTVVRIEGGVFSAIILVALLGSKRLKDKYRTVFRLGLSVLLAEVIWFLGVFYKSNGSYDAAFWTPGKALAQILLLLVCLAYMKFSQHIKIKYVYGNEPQIMLVTFLVVMLSTAAIDYGNAITNYVSIFKSVFLYGYWNIFWYGSLVILAGLFLARLGHEKYREFIFICLSYMIGILVFSIFRKEVYHPGISDSALRMVLHIMLTVVFTQGLVWKNLFADLADCNGEKSET